MATFVYGLNVSLDGFVDHTEFAPRPGIFRHFISEVQRQAGSLYGREMYAAMSYWDANDPDWDSDEKEYADAWQLLPKWVVSTTLTSVGPNATIIGTDVEARLRQLKADVDGEIEVAGPRLAQSLTDFGLIDLYRMYVHPVVLGQGTPYFIAPPPELTLVSHERLPDDVLQLTYAPIGK